MSKEDIFKRIEFLSIPISFIPLTALSDQACLILENNNFLLWYLYKNDLRISTVQENIENKTFKPVNHQYLSHY